MVGLTTKQKEELNQAILEYLVKHGYSQSVAAFCEESGLTMPDTGGVGTKMKDILEKKWTSIVKLTKQKMDLEKQIKFLKEEATCERCEGMQSLDSVFGKSGLSEALPREPAKFTMQGHRGKITKIIAHPYYNLAASASEDSSVRLWDFD